MTDEQKGYFITKVEAAEVLGICPDGLKAWERRFGCRLCKVRSDGGDQLLVSVEGLREQIEMRYYE